MGEYADLAIDEALLQELEYDRELDAERVIKRAQSGIWTTREGDKIHVRDMAESHLTNTILYLTRRDVVLYQPWITLMQSELKRRNRNE